MIGIYKITNKINGKVYIGQSNNIERRKREHFDWNKTSKQYIDIIIRDLGQENFSFEVLEECLEDWYEVLFENYDIILEMGLPLNDYDYMVLDEIYEDIYNE